jgi:molybdenum cofactor guanylyltransferase
MVAGVLLTGGASRRLGVDKATLRYRGETLAERAARVMRDVCDDVIEVGPGVTSLRAVRESPPGSGPVAALVAGATALRAAAVILLACDMPLVEPPLLELIGSYPGSETVVPVADGRAQYTCARYGATALATAVASGGRGGLKDLVAADAVLLDEPQWRLVAPADAFADLDTPADLSRFGIEARR